MELCTVRASAAIVQHVAPADRAWFLDWQQGITATAIRYPGYQGTDVYPPADAGGDEWVVVVHFEDDATLANWLASAERTAWLNRLHEKSAAFEVKSLRGGFSNWFAGLSQSAAAPVPSWKMALVVLLGLYPTVMLLSMFVAPRLESLGTALSMLICNALSVAALQWLVVPALEVPLRPWLQANLSATRRTLAGAIVVVTALLSMAIGFRALAG